MVEAARQFGLPKVESADQLESLQSLQIENEQLKAMIEIMKVEMEQVLREVSKPQK